MLGDVALLVATYEIRKFYQTSKIPKPECVSGHSKQL